MNVSNEVTVCQRSS